MTRKPTKEIQKIVQRGFDCSPQSYRRAATQRLDVATYLLKNSNYYLDALYLAGYAVECSLKALILKRTPRSKWAAVCQEISSTAKPHDVNFLKGILERRQCLIPRETAESLNVVKREWRTNLRYTGAVIPYEESESFIKTVASFYDWAERSA